jgi:hypothetical protein
MRLKNNIVISENGFMFNPSTGDSYTLNNTAREILILVKDGKSVEEIGKLIKEKYEIDVAILERYLVDFVNDLAVHNLLEE